MPLSKHFYYVKPARGFKLWPEMGMYSTMALDTQTLRAHQEGA
jgi:hypothetical protein